MDIRIARKEDVSRIVAFHSQQFEDYYLTQLGSKVLESYYGFFISSAKNKCFITLDGEEVVGLALFVTDFDAHISRFYATYKMLLSVSIIKSLLKFNKIVWGGTLERVKNVFKKSDDSLELPKLTLLSLAVSKEHRGHGIGQELLEHAEEYYRQKQIKSYYLSVLSKNKKAIKFYEKNGFVKVGLKDRLYYMEKNI